MSQTLQTGSQDLNGAYDSSARAILRKVFLGNQGVRIVWSVLLFVAIYQALHMVFSAVLSHFFSEPTGAIPVIPALLQESLELLAAFLATWTMARIENRGVLSYGYTGNHRLARMVSGTVWGFLCLSVLVGILWRMGWIVFDRPSLTGFAAWKYALAWGLLFLIVGVFEESLLRGYLQYTLSRGIGFWRAALLLSVVFALWHISNNGESTLGLLEVGLSGLYFCLTLWYTKSLWWAIGFHAGWDWGQSYFYGTADSGLVMQGHLLSSHPAGNPLWSGGTAGPEGSLLITPLVIVMAAGMWVWWGRIKKSGPKEPFW